MQGTKPAIVSRLGKKPNLKKDNETQGVVLNFKRSLPASAVKRPSSENMSDFKKMAATASSASDEAIINRGSEIGSEIGSESGSASDSEDVGTQFASKKRSSAAFTDKRSVVEIDRDKIFNIVQRLRIAPRLPALAPTTKRIDVSELDKAAVDARVPEMEITVQPQQDEGPQAVKLKKSAILTNMPEIKRNKSDAAADAADAADAEAFAGPGVSADTENIMVESAAEPPVKVIKIRQRKPKTVPILPVSSAASIAKEQVTKIAQKSKDDAKRDDKYALSSAVMIGDEIVSQRLPQKRELPQVQASEFYMNNRSKFIQYINSLFHTYREELTSGDSEISCEALYGGDDSSAVSLLTHQKIVRDYLNIFSPYRGLLLFHGLGSGKTCSSIAIAEGLKTFKKIIVMTPASLRMNFMEEMKSKCGDLMYKKNQFWEFIPSRGNAALTDTLSSILGISKTFISRQGGAWLVNVKKPSNYETELTPGERVTVDKQINEMIREKYEFVNYNGLRSDYLKKWSNDYSQNPFDNKVIIIDEAHNFVSRIVNKLKRPTTMAYRLYDFLLSAQNAKVVLLTGTPIINYPNEIAVLFNILRGNIDNWVFTVDNSKSAPGAPSKLNLETFKEIFGLTNTTNAIGDKSGKAGKGSGSGAGAGAVASRNASFARGIGLSFDNLEYNPRNHHLMITRNPFGFVRDYDPVSSKYKGVIRRGDPSAIVEEEMPSRGDSGSAEAQSLISVQDHTATENGVLSDAAFEKAIIQKLADNGLVVTRASSNKQAPYTALPSNKDEFNNFFIDPQTLELKNRDLFIRRILGLTSYFRSAQEKLLPSYDPETNFHVIESEMSDYQFAIYSRIRDIERNQESQSKKNAKRGGPGKGKKAAGTGTGDNTDNIYEDVSSTYRIFSRAFCNFVFPKGIHRPLPGDTESASGAISKAAELGGEIAPEEDLAARITRVFTKGVSGEVKRGRKPKIGDSGAAAAASADESNPEQLIDENMIDGIEIEEDHEDTIITGEVNDDAPISVGVDIESEEMSSKTQATARLSKKAYVLQYQTAIEKSMRDLQSHAVDYLTPDKLATYSPKFLHLLQNILSTEEDERRTGLHLIYSQFRTLEGIGILKLVLETNGFSHFKIKQSSLGDWTIDMTPEERSRPCFALYTGTESPEEKEIVRNIFNSKWKNVPKTILDVLTPSYSNNISGQVIKILMITASGAEGINLRNVRYVHITEPYWHPVRTEQIIGRARRICSHIDLPEDLRTVDVYLYVSRFSGRQIAIDNDESLSIRMNDRSKTDNITPMTTDQSLYEISNIKSRITKQILTAVKESSFDCMIHSNPDSKEQLKCYYFGADVNEESLAYKPDIRADDDDSSSKLNKKTIKTVLSEVVISGKAYAIDKATNIIYDYEQSKMKNQIRVGVLLVIPANPKTGEPAKYNFVPDT